MDRVRTAAAVLHYAEGTLGPVAFHPDGCGTCARAVELVDQVDRTYPAEDDPMPVFVIKAKDQLALPTIAEYRQQCQFNGLAEQSEEVQRAYAEMKGWQQRHLDRVQMPDHEHVPAARPNSRDVLERLVKAHGPLSWNDMQEMLNRGGDWGPAVDISQQAVAKLLKQPGGNDPVAWLVERAPGEPYDHRERKGDLTHA